eukprot:Sspe_Gene.33034::Locus_16162_Transcript_1_1_Confidence_1.000_Length_652::g.33034::m.33034
MMWVLVLLGAVLEANGRLVSYLNFEGGNLDDAALGFTPTSFGLPSADPVQYVAEGCGNTAVELPPSRAINVAGTDYIPVGAGGSAFAIAMWVRVKDMPMRAKRCLLRIGRTYPARIYATDTYYEFTANGETVSTTHSGQWDHVQGYISSAFIKLFVNGAYSGTQAVVRISGFDEFFVLGSSSHDAITEAE